MKKSIIASVVALGVLGGATVPANAMTMFKEPPFESYKVYKGDSFSLIAKRYGLDYKKLMELNPTVDPMNMQVGSVIRLMPEKTANQEEVITNKIINTGLSLIGKAEYSDLGKVDYASLKFRCASFLDYIFKQNGIDLGTANEDDMYEMGTPVERKNLKRGDLVFFDGNHNGLIEHVGIYIGDNKLLHMANHKLDVVVSDMNGSYYKEAYYGAKRVIPSLLP
ncbi:NlpC/P60 family protein [Bacillus sp. JJ1503]|uniref:C40 family peptidase n=1 Tax=unclassified Bacillus (in: firmicutes) TaxID=185979 RepID=UPI002FFE7C26